MMLRKMYGTLLPTISIDYYITINFKKSLQLHAYCIHDNGIKNAMAGIYMCKERSEDSRKPFAKLVDKKVE